MLVSFEMNGLVIAIWNANNNAFFQSRAASLWIIT